MSTPQPKAVLGYLWAIQGSPRFLRRIAALAVLALAIGIVSGGAVRLSGSGLGCSDWPACTSTSIVAPLQYHAWVEFGNRLVNVVITIAIVLVVLGALRRQPRRRDLTALASGLVAGIFAEVVLGGETVLHKLAPPYVMAHFLLAVVLLVDAVVLYHRSTQPDEALADRATRTTSALGAPGAPVAAAGAAPRTAPGAPPVPLPGAGAGRARVAPAACLVRRGHVVAARTMLVLTALVVMLGTVVTSTGPHAGAPGVPRFGFSLHTVAQLHGTSVEVLLAVTVATLWSMHRARAAAAVLRRGEILLVVLVAQAAVGYTQYLSGDPVLLVGVHLTGATVVVIAMTAFNLGLYARDGSLAVQTVAEGHDRLRELART